MASPAASKTTRNAVVLIIASVFSNGIQFIWQIALGASLGPEAYGVYGTVVSLMAVSTAVANFGLGVILIRDVSRHPDKIAQYWTARLFLQTILGLLAYIMSISAAILAGYDHIILAYTAIGGLSLLIDIFGTMTADLLIAQERMMLRSLIEVGSIILRVLMAAVFLAMGWGLIGVYIATLVTGVLRSILFWGAHTIKGFWPQMPLDRRLTWRFFWDAAPLAAAAFFNLLYQHIDKLITTALIGVRGTGYLGPAFIISSGVIEVLNMTILTALFPYMSRQYVTDPQEYSRRVSTLLRLMFVFSLPIALTITLFAEPIVLTIFKAQYAPTIGVLRFLIWFTFLTMIGNVLVQALQVQNRQRRVLWIRVGGLIVNVVFTTLVLVIYRDPQGAALSAALGQGLVLVLLFLQFPELIFTDPRKIREKAALERFQDVIVALRPALLYIGRIAVLSLATILVMILVGQLHFVLGIIVGLLVYGALIWWGGLADSDRVLVNQILAIMPGHAWLRARWVR